MPLEKHLIWVRWEDVTTEELMAFHGVMLNMAKHVSLTHSLSAYVLWFAGFYMLQ